jgi:hypothetical protein
VKLPEDPRDVRHARNFERRDLDARDPQRFANDRMLHLVDRAHALDLRVLDDQILDERVVQRDVHVLVDRRRDDEAAVLAIVGRQVGATAAEGNPQRASRDDHA